MRRCYAMVIILIIMIGQFPQGMEARKKEPCLARALSIGIDDIGEDGWIELCKESPLTLVIHRIVRGSGKAREASMKFTFENGSCIIQGMGLSNKLSYKKYPFSKNNLTQYQSNNNYVCDSPLLDSFQGSLMCQFKKQTIIDGIRYDGTNYTLSFNCKYNENDIKPNCQCSTAFPSSSGRASSVPMWLRAWDLDNDGIPEHCIGICQYRFLGIEVFSETPGNFTRLKEVTDEIISTDLRNSKERIIEIFSRSFQKSIKLKE